MRSRHIVAVTSSLLLTSCAPIGQFEAAVIAEGGVSAKNELTVCCGATCRTVAPIDTTLTLCAATLPRDVPDLQTEVTIIDPATGHIARIQIASGCKPGPRCDMLMLEQDFVVVDLDRCRISIDRTIIQYSDGVADIELPEVYFWTPTDCPDTSPATP
jgi:hypothetical protein